MRWGSINQPWPLCHLCQGRGKATLGTWAATLTAGTAGRCRGYAMLPACAAAVHSYLLHAACLARIPASGWGQKQHSEGRRCSARGCGGRRRMAKRVVVGSRRVCRAATPRRTTSTHAPTLTTSFSCSFARARYARLREVCACEPRFTVLTAGTDGPGKPTWSALITLPP